MHKDFSVMPNQGIVLENAGLYPNLTGKQNLLYLANINHKVGEEDVVKTLQRVGLNPQDKRIYQKYSPGMKQRLIIAQAIMEKPDIIFWDEPTNSLDENGVNENRTIIKQERDREALILLSSHNNDDIMELADKVYKMESGEIKEWNNENPEKNVSKEVKEARPKHFGRGGYHEENPFMYIVCLCYCHSRMWNSKR